MGSETTSPPVTSRKMFWAGWVMSVLPVPLLGMSCSMKIFKGAEAVKGFAEMGYPAGVIVPLGIVELTCTILYLIPQTAVLGAILLTGYLGGAVDVHVRTADTFAHTATPIALGILVWGGLFLRDPRIRSLIPFKRK